MKQTLTGNCSSAPLKNFLPGAYNHISIYAVFKFSSNAVYWTFPIMYFIVTSGYIKRRVDRYSGYGETNLAGW